MVVRGVIEVGFAAGFDDGDIAIHDLILCAGELLDLGTAGAVVVVGVADEQDLDVAELEAEGFDAFPDQRTEDSRLLLMRMSPCGVTMR